MKIGSYEVKLVEMYTPSLREKLMDIVMQIRKGDRSQVSAVYEMVFLFIESVVDKEANSIGDKSVLLSVDIMEFEKLLTAVIPLASIDRAVAEVIKASSVNYMNEEIDKAVSGFAQKKTDV